MEYDLRFVDSLPDPAAFEDLMAAYFDVMIPQMIAAGGPALSARDMARKTVSDMAEYLPPSGRTLLAHDSVGTLVGCGVIRRIRPDAVELKRMFVRAEAQGAGLGRRLMDMRLAEARRMGATTYYADTVRGNHRMLEMYARSGFTLIPRYPENGNDPSLDPILVYLKRRDGDAAGGR